MYSPNHSPEKNNRLRGLIIGIAAVVLIIVLFLVFGGHKKDAASAAPPATDVTITKVVSGDVPVSFEYAGRTAGNREVEIRARVSGILLKRDYQEGQLVQAGDLLFEIDPAPFQAVLSQAEATLNQTERDWKRVEQLYNLKALSARERDQALSAYETAKAQAKTAHINLGYTKVVAPITGVTSSEAMSEGGLVVADQSLLTRLTQLDPLYINFAYPDTEATQQRRDLASGRLAMPEDKKLKAEIRFGDGTVFPVEGDINFTDSIVDEQTGSVRARATLPNSDGSLLPGQFVRVVVKGFIRKNAISIPDQAVIQSPQGAMVYVVDNDKKAQIRPVILGTLTGTQRLIETGLADGDQVISEGMIKVKPGASVNAKEADPAASNPDAATTPAAVPASAAPTSNAALGASVSGAPPTTAAPPASTADKPANDNSVLMKDPAPPAAQPSAPASAVSIPAANGNAK